MSTETSISLAPVSPPSRETNPPVRVQTPPPQITTSGQGTQSDARSNDQAASSSFSLQFDPETQHLILEARDPVTGAVLFQVPSRYVIEQIQAQSTPSTSGSRGGRIDRSV